MAIHLNKIYTKNGDDGKTALVGGNRISKGAVKIEAYGSVDELNSHLGMIRSVAIANKDLPQDVVDNILSVYPKIQNELFDVGAILATPEGETYEGLPEIKDEQIGYLEDQIDEYQKILEPLKSFVLPGGHMITAHAHIARTVCRRVERELVRLKEIEAVDKNLVIYINRLSDYLFVFARWISKKTDTPEFLWQH